jgi:hypothetical protein
MFFGNVANRTQDYRRHNPEHHSPHYRFRDNLKYREEKARFLMYMLRVILRVLWASAQGRYTFAALRAVMAAMAVCLV